MSFLSRKPVRPDGRGRGDGYDDYADDGYAQSEDDGWSPNEYFSPEGIKGRWAGETPAGRSGGRGQRDADRESGRSRNSYGSDFDDPGQRGPGYGADEYPSDVYDLPDGADEDRGDRRRSRRSRDREDRGERTGILRLRRDRGEDIWPDDDISDEDYWASVAADRPLSGSDSLPDSGPAAGGARSGAAPRPGMDSRAPADARFGGDQRGGERGDQRGGERGGAGRLGPPPGLSADYKPGGGPGGGTGQQGRAGRTGSGPLPVRPGTGAHPVRPGTGPTPAVGVTSSRPPARPGPGKSGPGTGGFPQPPARPSFQPNGSRSGGQPGSGAGGGRQQDWGDRTERIERVNAAGYPEPRPGGRGQGPGPAGERGESGPLRLGPGSSGGARTSGPSRALGAPERGRGDAPAWRGPDRRPPDRRAPGGDAGRAASGSWPTAAPSRGGAPARGGDDPLTSKAYSRAAMTETDGRSYRVAARRSQAQAKLTEQAETFIRGGYQQPPQDQPGRGGEYWQYREDTHAPAPQAAGGRHSAPGDQGGHLPPPSRGMASPGMAGPAQAGPAQAGPAPVPGLPAQPAFAPGNPDNPGRPAGSAGSGGLNPYDSAITGSYPYASQPYPALPAPVGPAQDGAGDPYYQPSPGPGYPADAHPGASQGRTDQGGPGYGGYPGPGDRRY